MIRLLKLQKAVYLIVLGILSFIISRILYGNQSKSGIYFEMISGALLMIGALWFLYPVLFAKKNSDGNVEVLVDEDLADEQDDSEVNTGTK